MGNPADDGLAVDAHQHMDISAMRSCDSGKYCTIVAVFD